MMLSFVIVCTLSVTQQLVYLRTGICCLKTRSFPVVHAFKFESHTYTIILRPFLFSAYSLLLLFYSFAHNVLFPYSSVQWCVDME